MFLWILTSALTKLPVAELIVNGYETHAARKLSRLDGTIASLTHLFSFRGGNISGRGGIRASEETLGYDLSEGFMSEKYFKAAFLKSLALSLRNTM